MLLLLAVITSYQAAGDRQSNVTLVMKSQLHSNTSPSAVKLPSSTEATGFFFFFLLPMQFNVIKNAHS